MIKGLFYIQNDTVTVFNPFMKGVKDVFYRFIKNSTRLSLVVSNDF